MPHPEYPGSFMSIGNDGLNKYMVPGQRRSNFPVFMQQQQQAQAYKPEVAPDLAGPANFRTLNNNANYIDINNRQRFYNLLTNKFNPTG